MFCKILCQHPSDLFTTWLLSQGMFSLDTFRWLSQLARRIVVTYNAFPSTNSVCMTSAIFLKLEPHPPTEKLPRPTVVPTLLTNFGIPVKIVQ